MYLLGPTVVCVWAPAALAARLEYLSSESQAPLETLRSARPPPTTHGCMVLGEVNCSILHRHINRYRKHNV